MVYTSFIFSLRSKIWQPCLCYKHTPSSFCNTLGICLRRCTHPRNLSKGDVCGAPTAGDKCCVEGWSGVRSWSKPLWDRRVGMEAAQDRLGRILAGWFITEMENESILSTGKLLHWLHEPNTSSLLWESKWVDWGFFQVNKTVCTCFSVMCSYVFVWVAKVSSNHCLSWTSIRS